MLFCRYFVFFLCELTVVHAIILLTETYGVCHHITLFAYCYLASWELPRAACVIVLLNYVLSKR